MLKKLLTISALLCASCAFARVDANQATQAELDAIKGIGPALSQRIITQRKKAPFADWADLIDRVHGVGNTSAARFSAEGLTVNGRTFPGAQTPHGRNAPAATPAMAADKAPSPTLR
ncbi:MAG: helix-hairpin-helix domain-containing protein [Comamonas sp.]|uniref:ComEA family DNA-binding protein n=1 Tax=Comamonas sp. TaxID=34028 RepID=UPI002FC73BB8